MEPRTARWEEEPSASHGWGAGRERAPPARQELAAILTISKRRAKEVELILARRSPSTEGSAAEPPPPCQVCCAHVFLPVYPSGPRDNGEFESRCEKCGLPEYAR